MSGKAGKIRMDSEPVRVDPNLTEKAAFLAFVDEVRMRALMSVKEMAINAAIPESQMSEALAGVHGRGNLAGHWLWSQPEQFWLAFVDLLLLKKGIRKEDRARIRAEQIGHLVALLVESTVVDE